VVLRRVILLLGSKVLEEFAAFAFRVSSNLTLKAAIIIIIIIIIIENFFRILSMVVGGAKLHITLETKFVPTVFLLLLFLLLFL
jgi:hypothetical protein